MKEPAALAERAAKVAAQYPPRTPERRAAAALHVALATTKTTGAARRALGTVRDSEARLAALALLGQLERDALPDAVAHAAKIPETRP